MSKIGGLTGAVVVLALSSAAAAQDGGAAEWQPPPPALVERARALLEEVPLVDGHNDLPWELRARFRNHLAAIDLAKDQSGLEKPLHTDLGRLERGGVGAQFWSVYVPADIPNPTVAVLEQIDVVHRLAARYPQALEVATTAADVERIHRAGKVASLIGVEGGHAISDSLAVLRQLYAAGARYMTITHSKNTAWADSATDAPKVGGLSPFGVEVVREMNRLGMLVDLSHVSAEAMHAALDAAQAPVVFSHSSARALDAHPRNVPDDVLRRMPRNGGLVMVTFVPGFISEAVRAWWADEDAAEARLKALHPGDPEAAAAALAAWRKEHPEPSATLAQVADHVEHVRRVAGVEHVGIGSDFDGITTVPRGLEDVADYPLLLAELLRRGWSEGDVKKLAGENALRVLREAERTAARLQQERPASDALIDELDRPTAKSPEAVRSN
ncbi:MAG TPA: dipeptidase [Thermoanaerobaculia bacterium]|nr:dipeptidase [Thermoanaerobaculia bacterium]